MPNELEEIVREWIRRNNYTAHSYGKTPFIFIIGENHENRNHAQKQIELIESLGCKILIHEFARNYIFDFLKKEIYENPFYSLSPEIIEFSKEDIQKNEILYFLLHKNQKKFLRWLKKKGFISHLSLYESLWFSSDFFGNLSFLLESLEGKIKKIIGCDISYAERNYYELMHHVDLSSLRSRHRDHYFRERRFGEVILKTSLEENSPLIAIVGAYHIQRGSYIHKILRKRIEYICINQEQNF